MTIRFFEVCTVIADEYIFLSRFCLLPVVSGVLSNRPTVILAAALELDFELIYSAALSINYSELTYFVLK